MLIYARLFRCGAAVHGSTITPTRSWRSSSRPVPGVSQVSVFGQKQYAVAGRRSTRRARRARHRPGGRPQRAGQRDGQRPEGRASRARTRSITLDTNDQLFDAAQFGNVIIAYRNGAPVRVKDVGQAINSVQNIHVGAWLQRPAGRGHRDPARSRRQHASQLVDRIKALMPQLEQSIPPSVHVDLMSDRSVIIRAAVQRRADSR